MGNALEFYDFITYAFFAIQIGQTFFPSNDAFVSLMASLATFGAGFVTRPVGAYVLGAYADRRGRKPSMLLSMMLMGIGMLMLVVTPGYTAIGMAAPIVAVTARLVQGFALGGEVGSATSYLIESAAIHRRGLAVSWQGGSQQVAATLGALVGFGLSAVLSEQALTSYGWRISLAFGALIVPFALWIRSSLPETLHTAKAPGAVEDAGFRSYAKVIVLGFVMIGSGTIGTYIFNYMATFGQHTLKLSAAASLFAEFGVNFVALVAIVWGGAMSDRWGRRKIMIWPQLLFVLTIVPCFLWLTTAVSPLAFVASTVFLSAVAAPQYAGVYAAINESLPRAVRARAFALVYSIPVAAFGGTTQLFVTWLLKKTGEPIALAWYLTAVSVIGLIAMLLMPESSPRHRRLEHDPMPVEATGRPA
jgi:MFS family permease